MRVFIMLMLIFYQREIVTALVLAALAYWWTR